MVDFYVTIHLHVLLPHVHTPSHTTPVTRGVHSCVVLVSQKSTTCCCCLASPINTGGRKSITHHPPSLSTLSKLYRSYSHVQEVALVNIYTVHQLTIVLSVYEHCGRSVWEFCWYVFNGRPTRRKETECLWQIPRSWEWREEEKVSWVMGVCSYLLTAPTKLHCHPYHLRACTVTEQHESVM